MDIIHADYLNIQMIIINDEYIKFCDCQPLLTMSSGEFEYCLPDGSISGMVYEQILETDRNRYFKIRHGYFSSKAKYLESWIGEPQPLTEVEMKNELLNVENTTIRENLSIVSWYKNVELKENFSHKIRRCFLLYSDQFLQKLDYADLLNLGYKSTSIPTFSIFKKLYYFIPLVILFITFCYFFEIHPIWKLFPVVFVCCFAYVVFISAHNFTRMLSRGDDLIKPIQARHKNFMSKQKILIGSKYVKLDECQVLPSKVF